VIECSLINEALSNSLDCSLCSGLYIDRNSFLSVLIALMDDYGCVLACHSDLGFTALVEAHLLFLHYLSQSGGYWLPFLALVSLPVLSLVGSLGLVLGPPGGCILGHECLVFACLSV